MGVTYRSARGRLAASWRHMKAKQPQLEDGAKSMATLLAMIVRNAMENFHSEHLSDAQMRELNPIIRNAIATGLHALAHQADHDAVQRYIDYHLSQVPSYWEPPELLPGYQQVWARSAGDSDRFTRR
jgi:hypothetical protein